MAEQVKTRAAIWVSPQRIAISVVAAAAISALLLTAGGATSGASNGLLKKDDAPVAPVKVHGSGDERRPIMLRETLETPAESVPKERPAQWGSIMRKEAKEAPVAAAETARGRTMCVACIFGVLAIYSFGQQLRSAIHLLCQAFGLKDIKEK
eukprot:symbB.v1.2.006370.t1/scaffold371.1/size308833/17